MSSAPGSAPQHLPHCVPSWWPSGSSRPLCTSHPSCAGPTQQNRMWLIVPGISAHCDGGRGSPPRSPGDPAPPPPLSPPASLGVVPCVLESQLLSAQEQCRGQGTFHREMIDGDLTLHPTPAPCTLLTPSTPQGCPQPPKTSNLCLMGSPFPHATPSSDPTPRATWLMTPLPQPSLPHLSLTFTCCLEPALLRLHFPGAIPGSSLVAASPRRGRAQPKLPLGLWGPSA